MRNIIALIGFYLFLAPRGIALMPHGQEALEPQGINVIPQHAFAFTTLWYYMGTHYNVKSMETLIYRSGRQLGSCETFIIPDEIPSLLSVIYSNIPTVKKGTDSRLGWGFRLGDRADFQMIVELGPQQYTQPLGNELDKKVSSKRAAAPTLRDALKAQREAEKRAASLVKVKTTEAPKEVKQREQTNATEEGNRWLHSWAENLGKNNAKLAAKPGLGVGEIDAKSVIPEDSPTA